MAVLFSPILSSGLNLALAPASASAPASALGSVSSIWLPPAGFDSTKSASSFEISIPVFQENGPSVQLEADIKDGGAMDI